MLLAFPIILLMIIHLIKGQRKEIYLHLHFKPDYSFKTLTQGTNNLDSLIPSGNYWEKDYEIQFKGYIGDITIMNIFNDKYETGIAALFHVGTTTFDTNDITKYWTLSDGFYDLIPAHLLLQMTVGVYV